MSLSLNSTGLSLPKAGISDAPSLSLISSSITPASGLSLSGFDPNTTSFVAAVVANGGTVSAARQVLYNNLFTSLISAGLYSRLSRLSILAAENAQTAAIDLVTKTNTLTLTGAPTFTANQGYTGGTGKSIDTGAVPGTVALLTQNDNTYGAATLSTRTTGADTVLCGTTNNPGNFALYPETTGTPFLVVDDTGASKFSHSITPIPGASIKGLYQVVRTSSSNRQAYYNGASAQAITNDTSAAMLAFSFIICAYRNTDNATIFANSTDVVSLWFCGASFSSGQAASFATILNTYMTAIGSAMF